MSHPASLFNVDIIGCLLILAFMTLTSESLFYVTVQKLVGVDDQRTNLLITEKEEQRLGDWMRGTEAK